MPWGRPTGTEGPRPDPTGLLRSCEPWDTLRVTVSEGGLEPPCPIRALAPQASASANSATRTGDRRTCSARGGDEVSTPAGTSPGASPAPAAALSQPAGRLAEQSADDVE